MDEGGVLVIVMSLSIKLTGRFINATCTLTHEHNQLKNLS